MSQFRSSGCNSGILFLCSKLCTVLCCVVLYCTVECDTVCILVQCGLQSVMRIAVRLLDVVYAIVPCQHSTARHLMARHGIVQHSMA